jgi:hypothetical protein
MAEISHEDAMVFRRIGLLVCFLLLAGCPDQPEPNSNIPPLTEMQVKRFLASYLPVNAMASEYWGKRRYTKPGKILPRQGSFERAMKEMEAAGKLPEFQNLLATHGFADFETWKEMQDRISLAQREIIMEHRGRPNKKESLLKRRHMIEKRIAEIRENKKNLPLEAVQRNARSEEEVLKYMDKELLGLRDMETVRPFMPQFEAVIREHKKKQKRKEPAAPSKATGNPA